MKTLESVGVCSCNFFYPSIINNTMSRSFTIESITNSAGGKVNYTGGRFLGARPSDAVRKMFSKASAQSGDRSLVITLRETTSASAHKTFKYRVTKVAEKKTVERDGVEVTFNFATKVKSMN